MAIRIKLDLLFPSEVDILFGRVFLKVINSLLIPLWLIVWSGFSASAQVVINELLAATHAEDEQGISLEWIELYNLGTESVDLEGYTLTDDSDIPHKWHFPSVSIPGRGFLLVWTTGYDIHDNTEIHTNFQLDRSGEYLALRQPDGSLADVLYFPAQRAEISFGRQPDGADTWRYFASHTPGEANNTSSRAGFAARPVVSVRPGVYHTPVETALISDVSGTVIRYTTDCTIPTERSPIYVSPLEIAETTVIRARGFREDYYPGDVATFSYVIQESIDIPVISLVTEPDNLWDRRIGIYVNTEKHGIEWERPVSMEMFDITGERMFWENAGIRIHGGASRTRSPRKSFRLYFRPVYGAGKLHYPLFPSGRVETFNQLTLRGGFNDTWGYDNNSQRPTATYIRDQVARNLFLDMGQLAARGTWGELYLNGEYWGLYNLTERYEDDYFIQHSSFPDWDVIAEGELRDGTLDAWQDFTRFLSRASLRNDSAYQKIGEMLDLENFTAYIILNTWLQNYDWPHHNWYAARQHVEWGKWIYLPWDVEYSFGSGSQGYKVDQNTFQQAMDTAFGKLVQNSDYRQYFWSRVNELLNTVLSEEHVLQRLNEQVEMIRPVIPREALRWGYPRPERGLPQMHPEDWERAITQAREFISRRTPFFLKYAELVAGPRPVSVEDWGLY